MTALFKVICVFIGKLQLLDLGSLEICVFFFSDLNIEHKFDSHLYSQRLIAEV
jgi:hypothetical protein